MPPPPTTTQPALGPRLMVVPSQVVTSSDFCDTVTQETLCSILNSDGLSVPDELLLFQTVVRVLAAAPGLYTPCLRPHPLTAGLPCWLSCAVLWQVTWSESQLDIMKLDGKERTAAQVKIVVRVAHLHSPAAAVWRAQSTHPGACGRVCARVRVCVYLSVATLCVRRPPWPACAWG